MGSNGKCGLCKKYFKKGEKWHFQVVNNTPDNVITEKEHWDCNNTSWSPLEEQ